MSRLAAHMLSRCCALSLARSAARLSGARPCCSRTPARTKLKPSATRASGSAEAQRPPQCIELPHQPTSVPAGSGASWRAAARSKRSLSTPPSSGSAGRMCAYANRLWKFSSNSRGSTDMAPLRELTGVSGSQAESIVIPSISSDSRAVKSRCGVPKLLPGASSAAAAAGVGGRRLAIQQKTDESSSHSASALLTAPAGGVRQGARTGQATSASAQLSSSMNTNTGGQPAARNASAATASAPTADACASPHAHPDGVPPASPAARVPAASSALASVGSETK
mmetsp:Transcript_43711/g.108168  ORF Transcript_43711/g.108168 Transcript_43711/m.108168 type:complete len:281 (-) Transcript_43711:477-1319(-)